MHAATLRHSTRASLIATVALAGAAFGTPALADDANLDIRKIVLYRSGVGYFERAGAITGDQTVSLRFEADQINDILKSMVLLDLSPEVGGRVQTISYGSKEPLDRRLGSFDINISGAPDIASLFHQLRGEGVSIATNQGVTDGTILGIERRDTPPPKGMDGHDAFRQTFVNLVTTGGIQSIAIDGILSFEFSDPELGRQLQRALAALAEHRTDRLKTVDLVFEGPENRARDVMLSYVHETPVWKTSYRLVLPDDDDQKLTLQGWAIVENTTDQDWEAVQLSLASGRPVSFTMDLYEPIYAPRPQLPVPVSGGILAKNYDSGRMGDRQSRILSELARAQEPNAPASTMASRGLSSNEVRRREMAQMVMDQVTAPGEAGAFADGDMAELEEKIAGGYMNYGDNAPGSAASGGEVGEQFMYTLETPVTVERQRSAMIPIITAPIAGRRVSIYNSSDMPKHPMRGAQLVNDSDLHLMPGPIAVYDTHAYAGDSQIPHTSRNQSRLLAYALDIDVQARTEHASTARTVNLKIVDGLIVETVKSQMTTTYEFENHDAERDRIVLVEHPRSPGWDLVTPEEPGEKTDSLYRFETEVEAGEEGDFTVTQERVNYQRYAMTSYSLETLLSHFTNKRASQAVVDAVRQAANLQSQINRLDERIRELDAERDGIARDQDRIRNNMGRIDRNSQLYGRYMAKLNEQETRLETILEQRDRATEDRARTQRDLNEFIRDLDIE